jgi:hypothetical protein
VPSIGRPFSTSILKDVPGYVREFIVHRRETEAAARGALTAKTYQHYKGGIYLIEGLAIDTDDGEVRVTYQRVDGPGFNAQREAGVLYSRPFAEWFDVIPETGAARFRAVKLEFIYERLT